MSTNESTEKKGGDPDLHSRVQAWINEQGYPTEFSTANAFQRHGFRVFQGHYVRDDKSGSVREIDVLASRTVATTDYLVRAEYIVECKWSQANPWVVFTSTNAHMGHAACVAQTIGSLLGTTALWVLAGDESLHEMNLFATPDRPGFSGRQAFSKGDDQFYKAMKSVTTLASLAMRRYDYEIRSKGKMPRYVVAAFPVIVVDGHLFEAFYNSDSDNIKVAPANHVRCHWGGAPEWELHATIDVVSLSHLDEFIVKRAEEFDTLLHKMEICRNQIAQCFKQHTLDPLDVVLGARGIAGIPALLREALSDNEDLSDPRNDNAG